MVGVAYPATRRIPRRSRVRIATSGILVQGPRAELLRRGYPAVVSALHKQRQSVRLT